MMNSKQILTGFLSILTLTSISPAQADWDWTDVAALGIATAGVGACIYAATRPEDPHKVKRHAEELYQEIYCRNKQILQAARSTRSSEQLIQLVTHKGRSYQANQWFIHDSDYLSNDCRNHAPLLRGYAALLNESEELLDYRRRLIDCFGSVYAARHEYYNFENLTTLAHNLQAVAHQIARHHSFMLTRDNFAMYRTHREEQERLQRRLARTQAELAAACARGPYDYYDYCPCSHAGSNCQLSLNFYR